MKAYYRPPICVAIPYEWLPLETSAGDFTTDTDGWVLEQSLQIPLPP